MITWMQRHKKYLIITIWISTIAFVGAGFVGWGQYNYGDKAGAVAKVGKVEITMGELQKAYSNLYAQYNQMFQGNFDEEQAKAFGLQRQALSQLTNRALLLNLANDYDLRISDKELLETLVQQEYFLKDGVFDKQIYKEVLSRNNISVKEYETDLKKQLLIQKVFKLLAIDENENEKTLIDTVMNIADKIEYKVLSDDKITVDTSDDLVKPFWETQKANFMTEISYDVKYIKQGKATKEFTQEEINEYYLANKNNFKNDDGKLLSIEDSTEKILSELHNKSKKELALRKYIAFKKQKLDAEEKVYTATIAQNSEFGPEVFTKLQKATPASPYLKPIQIEDTYYTFELTKINQPREKTYEEAKPEIIKIYSQTKKQEKLQELAQKSLENFKGITTDFITNTDSSKITKLNTEEASKFVGELFKTQQKKGIIYLSNKKVVLYNILEQKLLNNTSTNKDNSIAKLKGTIFNEGLLQKLHEKYKTEIFVQGL